MPEGWVFWGVVQAEMQEKVWKMLRRSLCLVPMF